MVRAIERIERDIAVLQEAVGAIAAELQSTYASYLNSLGQAVEQQSILASYHLCTQGYPENFLRLSLNQRQQLQQAIRKLSQKVTRELVGYLRDQGGEVEVEDGSNNVVKSPDPSDPVQIAQWQQELEELIQETLKKVSNDANLLLQKAGILPRKLPEPILAVAAAASEASGEVVPGPPNLLNLVIEIEDDSEDSSLTQIMAINLRLGDIEFADSKLLSGRKQIRHILGQLNKLGREYQKKHRELIVAEAEAAWRASWFEKD
jgi:hypothetical protein